MKKIFCNGLDSYQIHMLAYVFMLIDHLGYYIFLEHPIFRIIGRLAFPLFSFCIAEGLKKTKSTGKYAFRIFVAACITELVYNFFICGSFLNPYTNNVLFTYFVAILGISLSDFSMDNTDNTFLKYVFLAICCTLSFTVAEFFNVDYGGQGCLLVFIFYYIDANTLIEKIIQMLLWAVLVFYGYPHFVHNIFGIMIYTEFFSLFSFPIIWTYNGQHGRNDKVTRTFFYSFYPVHLLILGLIEYFVIGW